MALLVFKSRFAFAALQIWVARAASQGHATAGVCVDACDPYYYWGPWEPRRWKESRLLKSKGYAELTPPFTGTWSCSTLALAAGALVPPHIGELISFLAVGVGEPPDGVDVGEGGYGPCLRVVVPAEAWID